VEITDVFLARKLVFIIYHGMNNFSDFCGKMGVFGDFSVFFIRLVI